MEEKWSGVVKEEQKPFNPTEWPNLGGSRTEDTKDSVKEEVLMQTEPGFVESLTTEFPSLRMSKSHRKVHRKSYQLSQTLSNEKPFEVKYSSKVRKRITKTCRLGSFMDKKPIKVVKDVKLEQLMQKIKDCQIVTFKGRKREIPKKKVTRLKRNILRIRAARGEELPKQHEPVSEVSVSPPLDSHLEVIESIENLKLEPKLEEKDPGLPYANDFQRTKEIVQHSRQFRSYCTNITSNLLCELTETFLVQLRIFQDKKHQKDPEKYKKRYVTGLSEVRKYLQVKKIKLLIIAPDLEQNAGAGGLDETVEQLKSVCEENHVPYLFSLKRRKIGYVLFKKVPVSCVGILSYEGCEAMYGRMMDELVDQVARYKEATVIS